MINWVEFGMLYIMGLVPIFALVVLEVKDMILYRTKNFVQVSKTLKTICFLGSFIALFGAVTNGLDYYYYPDGDLWFVVLMLTCYFALIIVLSVMYNEKIIYSQDCEQIILFKHFRKRHVFINDISRIYSGTEYLDIYLGKNRIRYANNFLSGANEFEHFIKKSHKS